MTDILIRIFWVLVICILASVLWFIFDTEKSRASTVIYDSVATSSEYESRRGNKAVIVVNRSCEVNWREYDDGIVVYIKFNKIEQ